jgi:starch synthase
MRVLFLAPEIAPLTKTGGLGDVCAALPAALRAAGTDVRVLVPGYPGVLDGVRTRGEALSLSALGFEAKLRPASLPGSDVPAFVLDCPQLYARSGGPYQDAEGADWADNPLRFGFFSRVGALLGSEASPLGWRPDVVHCNDWPSALAPVWLRFEAGAHASSLITIHNLAFQGNFDASLFPRLGLPPQSWSIDGVEFHGRLSFLKGGLACADLVNTVSPGYAREIQTPEFGCGFDGLLRHRAAALSGILNGIDGAIWDPSRDPHLPARYDAATLERKGASKAELQRRMGLEPDPRIPLIGQVGRLTEQKGVDLVLAAADELSRHAQLVVLGSGERAFESALRELAAAHPGRIAVHIGFDEALAHLVEAGSDLFLMPSRYEPCGLNQMYSQRYGTPPVVRATGGLADSVEDGATGFVFQNQDTQELLQAVDRALAARQDPARWRTIQRAGMARDFSWTAAARRYADLYRRLATLEPA